MLTVPDILAHYLLANLPRATKTTYLQKLNPKQKNNAYAPLKMQSIL